MLPAAAGADQVLPPLVDIRTCGVPSADPPASLPPEAETVTWATSCQDSDPPVTAGAVGAVRSIETVLPTVGEDGAHADRSPETSTERNCTRVVPVAVIETVVPVTAADQVTPLSVEVRYW